MPEASLFDKINGWLVAAAMGAVNLLFANWRSQEKKQRAALSDRVDAIEARKAEAADCDKLNATVCKKVDEIHRRIDNVFEKIDDSRKESNTRMDTIAGLIRTEKQ